MGNGKKHATVSTPKKKGNWRCCLQTTWLEGSIRSKSMLNFMQKQIEEIPWGRKPENGNKKGGSPKNS